jgi:hypothetical protein
MADRRSFRDLYGVGKSISPPPETIAIERSIRKKAVPFVCGAFPIELFSELEDAGRYAHVVFMCLLRKSRMKGINVVSFSKADVPAPLDEKARRRVLRSLQLKGFVRIEQRLGRPPLVDISPAMARFPLLNKRT